ncbi:hypothetical protein [Amycolatopsis tolypomycina]|uniref:Phage integrase family protein n=1 Tax=Amycolatopsis tolypomycina TaxID=208445 RepID=A0A1H4Y7S4_9PSEU|nr:hypothetical protein [Amycolatopsis tolypomycina]SED13191.1 hypothetical protein SAMN04489727_6554 [Amycolatopsis tolypomycina]
MYRHAVADQLIAEADNPATRVPKPRRPASTRRALPNDRLAEINDVAAATGNDPELDLLILRLHTEKWTRLGKHLPWVARQGVTTHWLRHTTLTWVERNFGYGIVREYAGHTGKSDAGTTTTYVRADLHEVGAALAAMTGEPHPLAARRQRDLSSARQYQRAA